MVLATDSPGARLAAWQEYPARRGIRVVACRVSGPMSGCAYLCFQGQLSRQASRDDGAAAWPAEDDLFGPRGETLLPQTTLSGQSEEARSRSRPGLLGPDSLVWLAAVSVLFVLSEMIPALLKLPLGADEITYIARTSVQSSAVFLPPVHGHGVGLLAAPVTLITTSLTALRIWMAILSGLALFGSLLCWRGLRPAWVLALAGLIFGSLAITELSGVQVYPDLWAAFGGLAITGLLLQAVNRRMRAGIVLPLIAFASLVIVLMRPQNIVFVLAPTFVAPLVVRQWRQPRVLIAMIIGMALGVVDWVAEAYMWFGGLSNRITLAGQEPPPFRVNFSLLMQIKTMSGPWYCQPAPYGDPTPCHPGFSHPAVYLWWLAFFVLVAVGLYAAWRLPTKASSLLAFVTAAWVGLLYIVFVPFGAPRYFLPCWALLAIVAADGIAWLVTVPTPRKIGVAAAGVFLLSGIVSQHVVLVAETSSATASRPFVQEANALRKAGIKPPCLIPSSPYVGYYLGCVGGWTGGTPSEVLSLTPGGTKGWRAINVPGRVSPVWVRR
jgi:hypothetical protein